MKKTTDELLKEMQTSDNAERFIKDNPEDIIFNGMEELFDYHIKTKGLKKGDVYDGAMIDRSFGRQIINGTRGATRDKVIQFCFGLKLDLAEAQQLLKISGNRELYVRDPRDIIIIFAIKERKSLVEANLDLEKHGFTVLA